LIVKRAHPVRLPQPLASKGWGSSLVSRSTEGHFPVHNVLTNATNQLDVTILRADHDVSSGSKLAETKRGFVSSAERFRVAADEGVRSDRFTEGLSTQGRGPYHTTETNDRESIIEDHGTVDERQIDDIFHTSSPVLAGSFSLRRFSKI